MRRREAISAILAAPIVAVRAIGAQSPDLTSLTIAQAGQRLASRDITPLQLANAYLAHIEQLNPSLNAFITVTADLARREAKALPSRKSVLPRLYGIPIAHKDLFETRGVRTTAGSLLFEDYTPDTNAAIVQQLEDAGAVLVGKTNTHELGGGVSTINPFFGTTRNPADHTRIPGGSSGGSAAAVVAHLCAAATGSDTGGSVRIPAAFCGCVGFKPTHGRFSTQGLIAASPTFDHVGFLTRTVEDMQIVTGLPTLTQTSPMRVGVANPYFFTGPDEVNTPFLDGVAHLGSLGHRITRVDVPVDDKTMARVFDPVFAFEMWSRFGPDWRTSPASFSKSMAGFFSSPRPSIAEYETGLAALEDYQAAVDTLFDSVDIILTPTVAAVAPPITGPIDGTRILRNTWPFNAAGTPAISVPAKTAGLPAGIQLIARRGEDDTLLRFARALGSS
ncbi:MAG: amidase [Acidimicrobiia bacterium]|nr:amidase [Acidimicrobiia bacterium]